MKIDRVTCPVCHSHSVSLFLSRKLVPVHQNLVAKDRQSSLEIARGDLDLYGCGDCGFVFNQAFDLSKLSYGEVYDNTQTHSPSFERYVGELVRYLVSEKGVQNCTIVEVGCGKGLFVRKLVEADAGNIGYGFDPSYVGEDTDLDGRLNFEKRYYGADCSHLQADVVVCRHVIEHVPEPLKLLSAIRTALANSPKARVFFETPCVEWILKHQVFWDFFYEHCSYFTASSLTTAFESSGFRVEAVNPIFGDQYLWLEATVCNENQSVSKSTGQIADLTRQFVESEEQLQTIWKEKLRSLKIQGNIAIWGAGAKGVTFANAIDPQHEWISCVVDLNPNKQGGYLPGTGHPIVSPQALADCAVKVAILMNPNYRGEIIELLNELNLEIELVE